MGYAVKINIECLLNILTLCNLIFMDIKKNYLNISTYSIYHICIILRQGIDSPCIFFCLCLTGILEIVPAEKITFSRIKIPLAELLQK